MPMSECSAGRQPAVQNPSHILEMLLLLLHPLQLLCFLVCNKLTTGLCGAALAKVVASKAHVASAYIEARTLKHEVLGSVKPV